MFIESGEQGHLRNVYFFEFVPIYERHLVVFPVKNSLVVHKMLSSGAVDVSFFQLAQ